MEISFEISLFYKFTKPVLFPEIDPLYHHVPSFLQLKQIAVGCRRYLKKNHIELRIHEYMRIKKIQRKKVEEWRQSTVIINRRVFFLLLSPVVGRRRLPRWSPSVDCAVGSGALGAQEVTGDLFVTSGLSQTTSCFSKTRLKRLRRLFFSPPSLPCCSLLVGWSLFVLTLLEVSPSIRL